MEGEGAAGCLVILIVMAIAIWGTLDFLFDDDPPEKPQQTIQQPVEQPKPKEEPKPEPKDRIEGFVTRLIPGPHDITTVVFEDGRHYDLNLGECRIYVGEWNQLRVDNGIVLEAQLKRD